MIVGAERNEMLWFLVSVSFYLLTDGDDLNFTALD